LLRQIFLFLLKVSTHSEKNKMAASNLAVCFGPNVLWPPEESPDFIKHSLKLNMVVEKLILSPEIMAE